MRVVSVLSEIDGGGAGSEIEAIDMWVGREDRDDADAW